MAICNITKKNIGFDIWEFDTTFPKEVLDAITLEAEVFPFSIIEGKRTDKNVRIWANQYESFGYKYICDYFDNKYTKKRFSDFVSFDLTECRTRIEICKDIKGSWLEEHVDDPAKEFTLQLYLSDLNISTTFNNVTTSAVTGSGWFFKNTATEKHGLPTLNDNRMSIIVNYVNKNWRDKNVLV